ncbi:MAG: cupredoxin domain-containing protein [Myxococcaceae bacterium]
MRNPKWTILGVALLLAGGCGRGADDKYAEATPDFAGLSMEISGAASEGSALVSDEGAQRQALGGSAIEYLENARTTVGHLNAAVKRAVTPIAELVAANAGKAAPGDVMVYGPKDRGTATYKFTIKKLTEIRFGWKLEAKAIGAADTDYRIVAAGALTKGQQPHRGRGSIGVDLTALKAIDTTVKAEGRLFCGFAHVGDTKTLVYLGKGFTTDPATMQPTDGAFVGHRLMPSKATAVRLVSLTNLADSPTVAKELVRTRVRFIPGVGGRADILATGGDVPAGKAYWGSACWDAQEEEGFAILRLCTKGPPVDCQVIATRGLLSNCRPGLETEQLPPEDPQATELEPEAPADEVSPPAAMPSGE